RARVWHGGGARGGLVPISRGACAAAVRDGDGPGAGGGRAAGESDRSRAAGEPVYRPRGLPQRLDRADGASRRGGGAGMPPGARLDSARGGRRRGRWSADRAVAHQSSGCLSLSRASEVLSVLSVAVHLTTPPSQPPAARTGAAVMRAWYERCASARTNTLE